MPKHILHTALFHYPNHLSMMLAHSNGSVHVAGGHHAGKILIHIHIRLSYIFGWFANLSTKVKLAAVFILLAIPSTALMTMFLTPKQVSYSFAGDNCFSNIVVLPGFVKAHSTQEYSVKMQPTLAIASYPLISTETCMKIHQRPESKSTVKLQAGPLKKSIDISAGTLPALEIITDLTKPVSPSEGVAFKLNQADETFSYSIVSEDKDSDCTKDELTVLCPLEDFKLAQGQPHNFIIQQKLGSSSEEIINQTLVTSDPIAIIKTSITEGQIVFDTPSRISILTNKSIKKTGKIEIYSDATKLESTTEITDIGFDILFTEALPRQAELSVSISDTNADDGAYLPEPYTINFSTSGGPKVNSVNFESYKVSPGRSLVIGFDSTISTGQDLTEFVRLLVGNELVQTSISASENKITITQNLPSCTPFTVQVIDGLANIYGVIGGSSWTMDSRITCGQTYSVGTSVQGRSLVAHRFGSGPTTILFVGGMHGNERSSYYTLKAWVDELEQNYNRIPSDKTVIVVPDINPDVFEAQTRTNANNVDLNRNFPSDDWASGIYMPGNIFLELGGGSAPLSEPESSALATLVEQINPRVVLTYHAVAKAVIANGAGDSIALSKLYADNAGYAHYDSGHEDSIFNYATTGEFETWLADKKAIPTLLIELATLSSNEMYSQRSAMWPMLSL